MGAKRAKAKPQRQDRPRGRGTRRQGGGRVGLHRANPIWIVALLLLAGIAYAAADRGSGLMPWHRLEVEVAQANARVRAHRVRNAYLAAEIRDLRADPAALEAAIREVIGWVKPGELRVDVETQAGALPVPPPHR